MMHDEKKIKVQDDSNAPPKPWLFKQLEKIGSAIFEERKKADKIRPLFDELFDKYTYERYTYSDEESKDYERYLIQNGITRVKVFGIHHNYSNVPSIRDIFLAYIVEFSHVLAHDDGKDRALISNFWYSWWTTRINKPEQSKYIDYLAFGVLSFLSPQIINQLLGDTLISNIPLHHLDLLGKEIYFNEPAHLKLIGRILEKFEGKDDGLASIGKKFRARAEALWVKEELKKETREEVSTLIKKAEESFIEKASSTTDEKIAKFEKQIQGVEARFIQIIGIFAAIIAFVVTIVPTAVRLGGASIPIALAGLAIVVTGIVILLAMIFGRREKVSKGLIAGISITGVLFAAWLGVTIWLAIQYPNIIAPQP